MSGLSECYTSVDMNTFVPKEYFKEYHFFEKFDQNKNYTTESFKKDFGQGDHIYTYCLYTLNGTIQYIVAREFTGDNLKELIPYCRCPYHTASWYNLSRFFICRCCVGCLDSPFPQQSIINASRKYMMEKRKK
jgi:hypothetical protein